VIPRLGLLILLKISFKISIFDYIKRKYKVYYAYRIINYICYDKGFVNTMILSVSFGRVTLRLDDLVDITYLK